VDVDSPGTTGRPQAWSFWGRWVLANAAGELVGLGLTGALGAAAALTIEAVFGSVAVIVSALLMVLGGTFEGAVVGVAQWLVLRQALTRLSRRSWVAATAIGALIAWILGVLPSTIIELATNGVGGEGDPAESVAEPDAWLIYLMAMLVGAIAGPILASAQWHVLRRHVRGAGWWIPANAAAWALGMPLVFLGIELMSDVGFGPAGLVLMVTIVAVAGAVVGAVHGSVLVRLLGLGARTPGVVHRP